MKRSLLILSVCVAFPAALAVVAAGCTTLECGPGFEKKTDDQGHEVCVAPSATGVPCDTDGGATVVGGVCVGDPRKFPSCGPGTKFDPSTGECLPDLPDGGSAGCLAPPPCAAGDEDAMHFCVNGVVRYLKDDSCTAGKTFEVRAYDPLAFIADPANAKPQNVTMTDANGGYKLGGLQDTSGQRLIAIAVTDPAGMGGTHAYFLSGSGAQNVSNDNTYRVDVYAIESSLVASWDQQAGLAGADTFEMNGAYFARFYTATDEKMAAAGVKLTFGNAPASDAFYCKGGATMLDKMATMTDASGCVVQKVAPQNLGTYSGTGGGVSTWESVLGASVPGVVFVQKFHPKM